MPGDFQALPLFAEQRVHHIHRKVAYVIEPCGEGHFAIHLRRGNVASIDRFHRHRQMTKGEIKVGVWLSACDGIGERCGSNGNYTFDYQTTEQLCKVHTHTAHLTTRAIGKQLVWAKSPSRQQPWHRRSQFPRAVLRGVALRRIDNNGWLSLSSEGAS